MPETQIQTYRVALFGAQAPELEAEVARHPNLTLVDEDPDVVISYGGDGTLLAAELAWPGVPKAPILNSRRGKRCIRHPAAEVVDHLAEGTLVRNRYTKVECAIQRRGDAEPDCYVTALNEINVHKGRINSAVRFRLWLNDYPYEEGTEILGDGLILCTPFGSTAYFNKITRCAFTQGIGIAFKATSEQTNHVVVPDIVTVRVLITRGPAVLAFDSSTQFFDLQAGDQLITRKHARGATILTCGPVHRLAEPF
ncbi:MAG TPA: hypothetical protein PKI11_04495 [Candidatus Hydrogenedentes bacterium]|nr:hypothetical protein [Candidatus Hydrogenedentota bacterium]